LWLLLAALAIIEEKIHTADKNQGNIMTKRPCGPNASNIVLFVWNCWLKLPESVICSNPLMTGKKSNNRPASMAAMCENPARIVDL
tara:strand:- start:52 stop:309 length:258 start_codon:yes stop_codon:yes gene_type:complete